MRTASEVVRSLEQRIARLEGRTASQSGPVNTYLVSMDPTALLAVTHGDQNLVSKTAQALVKALKGFGVRATIDGGGSYSITVRCWDSNLDLIEQACKSVHSNFWIV